MVSFLFGSIYAAFETKNMLLVFDVCFEKEWKMLLNLVLFEYYLVLAESIGFMYIFANCF